jgi:FkbM family methyltransferase
MTTVETTAPELAWDERYGIWFRPETFDLSVAREVSSYRLLNPSLGGTLLDVGGNIGAVSRWWLTSGGERSVTVEPEPANLRVLERNLDKFITDGSAVVVPLAATQPGAEPHMELYVSNGVNKGAHSLRPVRGRSTVTVGTVPFRSLVAEHSPRAVKVDIEGGEFALVPDLLDLPSSVTHLAIEWHVARPQARALAVEADAALQQSCGWSPLRGRLDSGAWFVMRVYTR